MQRSFDSVLGNSGLMKSQIKVIGAELLKYNLGVILAVFEFDLTEVDRL